MMPKFVLYFHHNNRYKGSYEEQSSSLFSNFYVLETLAKTHSTWEMMLD